LISTFAVPVYLFNVSLSHGAVVPPLIPDANELPTNKHNNKIKTFFMFLSFLVPLHGGVARSDGVGVD
jgi:hypothetical protein